MSTRIYLSSVLLLVAFAHIWSDDAPPGPNLVRNPSFEVGYDGYGFERSLDITGGRDTTPMPPDLDTATRVDGQVSLRLDNPHADALRLTMREVALTAGVRYTFSVWMKASVPGMNLLIDLRGNERDQPHNGAARLFKLTTTWQRYSLSLTPPTGYSHYYAEFHVNTGHVGAICTIPGSIWIDAVQFAAGDPPRFTSNPIELGLDPLLGRFFSTQVDQPFPVLVRLWNGGASALDARLRWRVVDDQAEQTVRSGVLAMSAAVNAAAQATIEDVTPRRRGSFRLEVERLDAQGGAAERADLSFVVADPVPSDPGLGGPLVAFNGCLDVRNLGNWRDNQIVVQYGFWNGSTYFDLASLAGQRWVRDWDAPVFNWRSIEIAEGHYDWTRVDRMLAEAERNGMRILPVLGGFWQRNFSSNNHIDVFPDWVVKRATFIPTVIQGEAAKGYRTPWPAPDGFLDFVTACVSRYRGRIAAWEVVNEPNASLTADQYTCLLKAVGQAVKAADPSAKVVGLSVTGDFNRHILGFTEACCRLGALEWCDAVSFHPYGAPLDSSRPMSASEMNSQIRALLDRYGGRGKELWNTECYYLGEVKPMDQNRLRGHEHARRFLLDLADGLAQSMSSHCTFLIRQQYLASNFSGNILGELVPSHLVPIYNTLAREFAGGRLARRLELSGRNQLLLVDHGSSLVAAAWSFADKDHEGDLLFANAVGAIDAIDMMGNPLTGTISADGHGLCFGLGHEPVYLKPARGISATAFTEILANAKVRSHDLFKLRGRTSQSGSGAVAVVEVENSGDVPVKAEVELSVDKDDAFQAGTTSGTLTIPPYGTANLIVPIIAGSTWTKPVPVKLRAVGQGQQAECTVDFAPPPPLAACSTLASAPQIDGVIDANEWPDAPAFSVSDRRRIVDGKPEGWSGPDDCSATVRLGWDQQCLYVALGVADAGRGERRVPAWVHDGDAVEIFLDLDPDHRLDVTSYTDRTCQILLGVPTALAPEPTLIQGGGVLRLDLASIRTLTKVHAGGFDAEMAIPWAQLGLKPVPGLVMGFDVAIDDADPPQAGRKLQMAWAGDAANHRNRMRFGRLVLGK